MANERHHNCCDHRDQNGISPLRYLADNICPKICSYQNVKPKNQRDMEPTGDINMLSDGPEQAGKQPDAKKLPNKKGAVRLRAKNPTGKKGDFNVRNSLRKSSIGVDIKLLYGKLTLFIAQMQMVDQLSLTP